MSKDTTNVPGMDNATAGYLAGKIKDGETLVGEGLYNDIMQFFQKLMSKAGLIANDDYDNETNGYQFVQALKQSDDAINTTTIEDLIARTFPMNFVILDIPSPTFESIDYPYGGDFNSAKFTGIVSYKKSGAVYVLDVAAVSATNTDLQAGIILVDDSSLKITAFETYLKVENIIPAAVSIENLSCSININAITGIV